MTWWVPLSARGHDAEVCARGRKLWWSRGPGDGDGDGDGGGDGGSGVAVLRLPARGERKVTTLFDWDLYFS